MIWHGTVRVAGREFRHVPLRCTYYHATLRSETGKEARLGQEDNSSLYPFKARYLSCAMSASGSSFVTAPMASVVENGSLHPPSEHPLPPSAPQSSDRHISSCFSSFSFPALLATPLDNEKSFCLVSNGTTAQQGHRLRRRTLPAVMSQRLSSLLVMI